MGQTPEQLSTEGQNEREDFNATPQLPSPAVDKPAPEIAQWPHKEKGGGYYQESPDSGFGWNPTTAMAIFSGILTAFTYLEWRILKRQRHNTERELRAYVFFDSSVTTIERLGDELLIRFGITNFGRTPAYDVRCKYQFRLTPTNDPAPFTLREATSVLIVPPGDTAYCPLPRCPFNEGIKNAIDSGISEIFVHGRVDFIDAFETRQWSTFRNKFVRSPEHGHIYALQFASEGNDASK